MIKHACLLLTTASLALLPACDDPAPPADNTSTTGTTADDANETPTPPVEGAATRNDHDQPDELVQTTDPAALPQERNEPAIQENAAAVLRLAPATLDLGIIDAKAATQAEGMLLNISQETLKIVKVQPSCACTDVTLTTTTLAPRSSTPFSLEFTPKSGTGVKKAQVRFFVEGFRVPAIFDIIGEVTLPVRVIPPHIDARETIDGSMVVQSVDDEPFRIFNVAGMAPQYADGFNPATDEPRKQYVLKWDLSIYDKETIPGWLVIETDRDDAPVVDVRVWHEWTRPDRSDIASTHWILSDQRILLGALKPAETTEISLLMKPLRATDVVETPLAASCLVDDVVVELVDSHAAADGAIECHVRVTCNQTETGLVYAPMTIHSPSQTRDVVLIGRMVADETVTSEQ